MEKEKGQLTLFDCRKVVSGRSWVVFDDGELAAHKDTLLQPFSSKHLLLNTLRKLDCYKLELSDLSRAGLGGAVATLAAHHPRQEVARLAGALEEKWRSQFDGDLFGQLEYDAEQAAGAPEGDPADFKLAAPQPPPPPPPPQPTRVQPPRKDRAQRLKDEDAFLDGSDFEGISESDSEEDSESEDDWQPSGARRSSAGSKGGMPSSSKPAKKAKSQQQ